MRERNCNDKSQFFQGYALHGGKRMNIQQVSELWGEKRGPLRFCVGDEPT
ncbi:hypothetical protein HMPREF0083_00876, partial [Aneurinibacillus aneurinilyticus ATCC 12856]